MEGESHVTDREGSIEPPRRRDSSDPVNLSLNSGASVTSDSSYDVIQRLDYTLYTLLFTRRTIVSNAI